MSNSTRRLERVGSIMTPTQLFSRWMEEVHQFHSLRDWTLSLKGQPDGAYPLVRLPTQMRAAVHQEMKGQAQDAIKRAASVAERDVIFLFHLCINANRDVLEERRANWLHVTLLISTLNQARAGETPTFGRQRWGEPASNFLLRVYTLAAVVDYISKRYFGGRSPLFPQSAEDLNDLVHYTEQVVEMYNDGLLELGPDGELRPKPELGLPIDVAEVKRRAEAVRAKATEQTIRLSKAETLIDLGDRRAAADLIQQHLD